MPLMRKLTEDEVRALNTKPLGERAQIAAAYDGYLLDFAPGDYGEVQLDEDDTRVTVRKRLHIAAERRGLVLTFRRTSGPTLQFHVEAASGGAETLEQPSLPDPEVEARSIEQDAPAVEETQAATAPKRRGSRPRAEVTPAATEKPAPKRRVRRPVVEHVTDAPAADEPKRRGRRPRATQE